MAARWALCLVLGAACVGGAAQAGSDTTAPLVLPLRRTALPPAAAAVHAARRRALLVDAGRSVNASALLPLYGSVRDNGVFTVQVSLGTPPQPFQLIVDTGSTLAYVPCRDCGANCGTHQARAARRCTC